MASKWWVRGRTQFSSTKTLCSGGVGVWSPTGLQVQKHHGASRETKLISHPGWAIGMCLRKTRA